jgi:hypothetical protein
MKKVEETQVKIKEVTEASSANIQKLLARTKENNAIIHLAGEKLISMISDFVS